MKKTSLLLPLLGYFMAQPIFAMVGESMPAPTSAPATTGTQHAQPNLMPAPAPTHPQASNAALPNQAQGATISTEQLQAIAKNLSPQQAQAIAQSFHQQMQAPGQEEMLALAPGATSAPSKEQTPQSLAELKSEQAFDALLEDVLPLSPEQIMRLHKFYDLTLQAKATSPVAPPTPNFTSMVVNLDPGSQPPIIRLAAGFVTSLIFVDSTGAPWPLTAYSIGDPQSFNIQWDQKGNALFVQSLKHYGHGNLAVRLHHLNTPIMLTLVSGQRNVDFRVDLQVAGRGPDAKPAVMESDVYNAKANPILMNILDGIPPTGSIKLEVHGGQGDAWLNDDKIYFRTKLTVLSPAWVATVASPDGTHVYELMPTPYIMASQDGKTVNIKLSGL